MIDWTTNLLPDRCPYCRLTQEDPEMTAACNCSRATRSVRYVSETRSTVTSTARDEPERPSWKKSTISWLRGRERGQQNRRPQDCGRHRHRGVGRGR